MQIIVLGLGLEKNDITLKAQECLLSGKLVLVRTQGTPSYQTIKELNIPHDCLDFVYEKSRSFDTLAKNLATEVLEKSKQAEVVYCVDGSALEDNSVKQIIAKHKDTIIIDGVSRVNSYLAKANIPSCKYTAISAYEQFAPLSLTAPLIVYDVDNSFLAGDIKLKLSLAFGEECNVKFISNGVVKNIKLFELDRQGVYDYSCAVIIEELPLIKKERFSFADLVEILNNLRKPDGCPWDRVQTNASIRINTIEEAYELVDAVDLDDDDKILEECGDVLLQSIFHAVIKNEQGAFGVEDVISHLCKKLVDRHTHIFGNDKAKDANEAFGFWEKNKHIEKNQKTASDCVKDVPENFPAVMFAQKIQKRASKGGFDYSNLSQAVADLQLEIIELEDAIQSGKQEEISLEAGDLLFSAVNVGRMANAECEIALRDSAKKFAKRFIETERLILLSGKEMKSLSNEELDYFYRQAKQNVG